MEARDRGRVSAALLLQVFPPWPISGCHPREVTAFGTERDAYNGPLGELANDSRCSNRPLGVGCARCPVLQAECKGHKARVLLDLSVEHKGEKVPFRGTCHRQRKWYGENTKEEVVICGQLDHGIALNAGMRDA